MLCMSYVAGSDDDLYYCCRQLGAHVGIASNVYRHPHSHPTALAPAFTKNSHPHALTPSEMCVFRPHDDAVNSRWIQIAAAAAGRDCGCGGGAMFTINVRNLICDTMVELAL